MGGGFSNILGHVAEGYTQAAQVDKQRQFEAEMEHRNQVVGLLQKLAFDETATPETRSAALAHIGDVTAMPITKPYKFDAYKTGIVRPGQPKSMTTPGLTAPAPPPGAQPTFSAAPGLPPGVAGPPDSASVNAAPQMSMPAAPPGLLQAGVQGAGAGTVSTPGQAGAFMSPQDVTAMQAARAGAVTSATAGAQMATPIYQQGANGGLNAVPISHGGTVMGPAIPNVIPPQMFTGQIQGDKIPASIARQNGIPVPDDVPDDGWVNVRRNKAGMITNVAPTVPPPAFAAQSGTSKTTDPVTGLTITSSSQRQRQVPGMKGGTGKLFTPVAPPGGELPTSRPAIATVSPVDNTVGGRVLPAAAIGIISSQARNYERSGITPTGKTAPIVQQYMQENGMTPHTTQQVADYQKGFDQAMNEDKRLKMMATLAQKVVGDPTPDNIGSYDAALLAYHMGMTVGQVKGMRSGKDMVLMHEKARSLPESLRQAAESWVNGAQLSPEQRENFVDLAKQSRQAAWSEAVTEAKGMGFSRFPQPTPGLPPLGLWPGVVNRQQLTSLAKDHHISYGDARKQAISAGMNIQD